MILKLCKVDTYKNRFFIMTFFSRDKAVKDFFVLMEI
jgi:hypothetical protein